MRHCVLLSITCTLVLGAAGCARDAAPAYDLVIANGRVIDPESRLDAVRHVGMTIGSIGGVRR